MTKEQRAYDLLLRWENNPTNCDGVDCFDVNNCKPCPFLKYCDEAREIVKGESRWQTLNG